VPPYLALAFLNSLCERSRVISFVVDHNFLKQSYPSERFGFNFPLLGFFFFISLFSSFTYVTESPLTFTFHSLSNSIAKGLLLQSKCYFISVIPEAASNLDDSEKHMRRHLKCLSLGLRHRQEYFVSYG
jgi:hypothetical protein